MCLSELISGLFTGPEPDSVDHPKQTEESGRPIFVHECRTCGTTVSAMTNRCPACEGADIVTHSIA